MSEEREFTVKVKMKERWVPHFFGDVEVYGSAWKERKLSYGLFLCRWRRRL